MVENDVMRFQFVIRRREIYSLINKNAESVHELSFAKIPKKWENLDLDKKWKSLFKIKQEANIAIEEKRTNKEIGSSLEADILINVNEKEFKLLEGLDLEEYFIASKVKKTQHQIKNKTKIEVKKSLLHIHHAAPQCEHHAPQRYSPIL